MVQCKKCKLFVSINKDDVLKCKGVCEGFYHKKCIKNYKQFSQTEMCEECQKGDKCPNAPPGRLSLDPEKASVESLLLEVNNKLEIIHKINERLNEAVEAIDFYAEQYQKMLEFKQSAEKKFTYLENKNIFLEKRNKALEERIEELEQREKEKNIEIIGLEKQNNEDITEMVKKISNKLNLNPKEIEDVKRVGKIKSNGKPQAVVVTLRTKTARDQWIAARKSKITNSLLYNNGNDNPIYINEDLTKYKRQLFWETKFQLKSKVKYIWVQNGNILVRKNDTEKAIYKIRNDSDIEQVAGRIE